MGKLIIPKNSADRKDLDACFDIYFEANDWVANELLIEKMKDALGHPHQEPQAYTKKHKYLLIMDLLNGRISRTPNQDEK